MIIYQATLEDARDLAEIHVTSWKEAYKGLVDQDFLDDLIINKYEERWRGWISEGVTNTLLLKTEENGNPAGFVTSGPLRTAPPGTSSVRPQYTAEIYALYVLPDDFGKGLGKALMQEAAEALLQEKHKGLCLWVLEKNKRALDFYLHLGGQAVGKKVVEIGRSKVKEKCIAWRDMRQLVNKA